MGEKGLDIGTELEQFYDFWIGMDAVYAKWSKSHSLTVNTVFVLHILANYPECKQSSLCEKLFLPKQTVNAVVNSLIKSGYAEKEISQADRRGKIILLTQKGRVFADKILGELDRFETGALGKMTPSERDAMIENNRIYLKYLSEGLHSADV